MLDAWLEGNQLFTRQKVHKHLKYTEWKVQLRTALDFLKLKPVDKQLLA